MSCVIVPIGQYTHQLLGLNNTIVINPKIVEVNITLKIHTGTTCSSSNSEYLFFLINRNVRQECQIAVLFHNIYYNIPLFLL